MHVEARLRFGVLVWLLLSACRSRVGEPENAAAPALAPAVSAQGKLLLELPPGRAGEWVDARRFRIRVLDAFPCDARQPDDQSVTVTDRVEQDTRPASATTPAKPGHYRLGVAIELEANDTVFATPKGAVLEKNGKVFGGIVDPRPSPACRVLLEPRTLRSGERASGIVVFEAPSPDYLTGATLKFRPPRWGQESRVGVVLPSCFGKECPESGPAAEAKL
jgi:hypothetical protein